MQARRRTRQYEASLSACVSSLHQVFDLVRAHGGEGGVPAVNRHAMEELRSGCRALEVDVSASGCRQDLELRANGYRNLQTLFLRGLPGAALSPACLVALGRAVRRLPSLRHLRIERIGGPAHPARLVGALHGKLSSLELPDVWVRERPSGDVTRDLATVWRSGVSKLAGLDRLQLSVPDQGLLAELPPTLSSLTRVTALRLDMDGSALDPEPMEAVVRALPASLHDLELRGTYLTGAWSGARLSAVADALSTRLAGLRRLSWRYGQPICVQVLAALPPGALPDLLELDLGSCWLCCKGSAQPLADALRRAPRGLQRLILDSAGITTDHLADLAPVLRELTAMRVLRIGRLHCRAGAADAIRRHLVPAVRAMPALQELEAVCTPLGWQAHGQYILPEEARELQAAMATGMMASGGRVHLIHPHLDV